MGLASGEATFYLGVLKNEAGFVCENIKLPEVLALPSAVLSAVNVLEHYRSVIQKILDSYNKGNAFNLLALSALTVLPEDHKKKVEAAKYFQKISPFLI